MKLLGARRLGGLPCSGSHAGSSYSYSGIRSPRLPSNEEQNPGAESPKQTSSQTAGQQPRPPPGKQLPPAAPLPVGSDRKALDAREARQTSSQESSQQPLEPPHREGVDQAEGEQPAHVTGVTFMASSIALNPNQSYK
uniref:Uncharacterized protein n=1 Tax=Sphaerodactylus townsendi TaxID=933632 RepID=A0ACB8EC52_9SAUR